MPVAPTAIERARDTIDALERAAIVVTRAAGQAWQEDADALRGCPIFA